MRKPAVYPKKHTLTGIPSNRCKTAWSNIKAPTGNCNIKALEIRDGLGVAEKEQLRVAGGGGGGAKEPQEVGRPPREQEGEVGHGAAQPRVPRQRALPGQPPPHLRPRQLAVSAAAPLQLQRRSFPAARRNLHPAHPQHPTTK